jgi:hypothetical protein
MERDTKKLGGRWREIPRNYSRRKMERDTEKLGGRWREIPRN